MFPIFLAVSRVTCGGGEPVPVLCVRVELRDTPAQPCSSLLTTSDNVSQAPLRSPWAITSRRLIPALNLQTFRSPGLQVLRSLGL